MLTIVELFVTEYKVFKHQYILKPVRCVLWPWKKDELYKRDNTSENKKAVK